MTELAESEILPELSDELSELVENEQAPSTSGKQTSASLIAFDRERSEHKCMIFSWLIKKMDLSRLFRHLKFFPV